MSTSNHNHQHTPNRFGVIPTAARLNANPEYTGKGVTVAFLDSGFYPHQDLVNRVIAYEDLTRERRDLFSTEPTESWQWHGTQTSVAAAGNGQLSSGVYRGLAHESELVLVKVSERGRITEENIAAGIRWVIANRERYNIRVLNISLGGDEDVPCSRSIVDQAAEAAINQGIVVVAAAGNSGAEGRHSIPPANSPSVITVGGYTDHNRLSGNELDLYHSNFGTTADGTVKPEIVAPAIWVAAPILPGTRSYERAEALSCLATALDYELPDLARGLRDAAELPETVVNADAIEIRAYVEAALQQEKIVAAHYQHVDGTSFAAPIVSAVIAQLLEANPELTPLAVREILFSTAKRIKGLPVERQGFGTIQPKKALLKTLKHQHILPPEQTPLVNTGKKTVEFYVQHDWATEISLVGDFNNWAPDELQLEPGRNGAWKISIPLLKPGRYYYKFHIDQTYWQEDVNNPLRESDGFDGFNSVLLVNSF